MGVAEEMRADGWSPLAAVEAESGLAFEEMKSELRAEQAAFRKELDKGVSPDAFKRGAAFLTAFDYALAGLDKARAKRHGG